MLIKAIGNTGIMKMLLLITNGIGAKIMRYQIMISKPNIITNILIIKPIGKQIMKMLILITNSIGQIMRHQIINSIGTLIMKMLILITNGIGVKIMRYLIIKAIGNTGIMNMNHIIMNILIIKAVGMNHDSFK